MFEQPFILRGNLCIKMNLGNKMASIMLSVRKNQLLTMVQMQILFFNINANKRILISSKNFPVVFN